MENLYCGQNELKLDPRGIFLIQNKDRNNFIWVGQEVPQENENVYIDTI